MTEPRPAATVLLLRDAAAGLCHLDRRHLDPGHLDSGHGGLEVFMVRRHRLMGFAGDALVFPGGRIDAADIALAGRTELCPPLPGVDATAMAFRVGALRETFEESGIVLARKNGQLVDGACAHALGQARAAVAKGELAFADLLAREGLILAADLLTPFAHWVTPAIFPKRYDTMFFLAPAPEDQTAAHDGEESVDSLWIAPGHALAGAADGKVEFVTRRNLEKLNRSAHVAAALAAAAASSIVTVQPVIEDTPQGRRAHLPPDADYGGALFDFAK